MNVPAELLRLGYALLRRIGGGSTAEVFEAKHNETGRRLAVKVSRGDVPEAELIVSRMQTEWNVGRGLRHPHLVTIVDGGTFGDGRAWLAMELLEGHDLLDELEAHGPMAPLRAVHIMRQVCEALQVLHRRGAIHRDVKPENIFLTVEGCSVDHVKLIDLGILSLPEDDPARQHEPTGRFILGTPLYLSPEQARGWRPDPRTDLYAVGGVLYHLLAGHPPFEGEEPTYVVARHLNESVPPLDEEVEGLPPSLVELVHRCLEKQQEDRPADAAEVIVALDACGRDLAGSFEEEASLRRAPLPAVPPPGRTSEWLQMCENLEHLVARFWSTTMPPDPLVAALNARREVLTTLERAQLEADVLREKADVGARHRIESRERLHRRARRIASALERHRRRQREALVVSDRATAALDAHDERYAEVLSRLAEVGPRVESASAAQVEAVRVEAESLLDERHALLKGLREARSLERQKAEVVAQLRADEIDLQRAFADQELDEQEEGFLTEGAAAAAVDARVDVEREHERASLRLLSAYAAGLVDPNGPSGELVH